MKKIGVIIGSFHRDYMVEMLDHVRSSAQSNDLEIIKEVWVPGSMEKPIMIKKLLREEEIDGLVVLGIIERGETKHGLVMGETVIQAIINLQLEFMKPIGVGIIGPEVYPSQITPRIKSYGIKAVEALAEMLGKL